MTFSLDGASPEVFERIRAGSSFEEVTANIRDLVRERGGAGRPRLTGWTVVTADNVGELDAIARLAADLGLDGLTIQTFLTDWGKTEMREHTGPVKVASLSPALERSLEAAREAAREAGLELAIASHDYYSEKRKCPWPWTSAFISASGDVVPCCIIADPETVSMGNIFEEDFRSIWNSPAYRELRRRIRSGDLPGYCRNCYGLD
jgi:pyrroloquinoline quinone biosynthesis protein E